MPVRVEMLHCSDCGYTLTKEEFDQICYADCFSKDHFIGLVEDGECPECTGGVLEEVRDG